MPFNVSNENNSYIQLFLLFHANITKIIAENTENRRSYLNRSLQNIWKICCSHSLFPSETHYRIMVGCIFCMNKYRTPHILHLQFTEDFKTVSCLLHTCICIICNNALLHNIYYTRPRNIQHQFMADYTPMHPRNIPRQFAKPSVQACGHVAPECYSILLSLRREWKNEEYCSIVNITYDDLLTSD